MGLPLVNLINLQLLVSVHSKLYALHSAHHIITQIS